jgi:8-oxo-dGTP diphosphatase
MSLAAPLVASPPVGDQPQHQRGAYAVVRDEKGRVLVVQTASGRCYLPGGRIEEGETPSEALAREIGEECGCHAEIHAPICSAEQRIFDGAIRLHASYWTARLTEAVIGTPEHVTLWLSPVEAESRLHRASDLRALALSPR